MTSYFFYIILYDLCFKRVNIGKNWFNFIWQPEYVPKNSSIWVAYSLNRSPTSYWISDQHWKTIGNNCFQWTRNELLFRSESLVCTKVRPLRCAQGRHARSGRERRTKQQPSTHTRTLARTAHTHSAARSDINLALLQAYWPRAMATSEAWMLTSLLLAAVLICFNPPLTRELTLFGYGEQRRGARDERGGGARPSAVSERRRIPPESQSYGARCMCARRDVLIKAIGLEINSAAPS